MEINNFCRILLTYFATVLISRAFGNEETCEPNPCMHDGVCFNSSGISCMCKDPYIGARCEIDPCDPNPCKNNGKCQPMDSTEGFKCTCPENYFDDLCDSFLNPCESYSCENGGQCQLDKGKPKCNCSGPYAGSKCEEKIATIFVSEITTSNVSSFGTTTLETTTSNLAVTTIKPGTTLKSTTSTSSESDNIDLCYQITCTYRGSCYVEDGRTKCRCNKPYTGLNCEKEITPSSVSSFGTATMETTESNLAVSTVKPSTILKSTSSTSNEHDSTMPETFETANSFSTSTTNTSDFTTTTKETDPYPTVSATNDNKRITKFTTFTSSKEETNPTKPLTTDTKTTNSAAFSSTSSKNLRSTTLKVIDPITSVVSTTQESNKVTKSYTISDEESDSTKPVIKTIATNSYNHSSTDESSFRTTTIGAIDPNTTLFTTPQSNRLSTFNHSITVETSESTGINTVTINSTDLSKFETSTMKIINRSTVSPTDKSNRITKSTAEVSSEKESSYSIDPGRFATSTMETNDPVSRTEETSTIVTLVTDEDVEIRKAEASSKTVAYICGATGSCLGLILLLAGIVHYLKRIKMKKRVRYSPHADSSSIGSAYSTSNLA